MTCLIYVEGSSAMVHLFTMFNGKPNCVTQFEYHQIMLGLVISIHCVWREQIQQILLFFIMCKIMYIKIIRSIVIIIHPWRI